MKRGTPDHPKLHALAAALGVKRWGAIGILESLWHFTAQYAHAGDVGRYSDDAIANALCWDDASTVLVSALVKTCWLDRCACHRLRVHDWPSHADQTVQRILTKRHQQFLACYDDPSSMLAPCYDETSQPLPLPLPLAKSLKPSPLPPAGALAGGNGKTTSRELERLEADPQISAVGDAWVAAFGRPRREIGVLRAIRTALLGGYEHTVLERVITVIGQVREAPERYPERGFIRWALEHGKANAGYLLRADSLDKIIPEVEAVSAKQVPVPVVEYKRPWEVPPKAGGK